MTSLVRACIIPAAYAVLPPSMGSPAATAMLIAIGLQESKFAARRQMPTGPARGFWQFERGGGVAGVLLHPSTHPHAQTALAALRYPRTTDAAQVWPWLEHNDVLACVFARLLLWTLPDRLPTSREADFAWGQYLKAWRPGKPHRSTWDAHYAEAWT